MEIILWKNAFFLHLVYEILILRPQKNCPPEGVQLKEGVFFMDFFILLRDPLFL